MSADNAADFCRRFQRHLLATRQRYLERRSGFSRRGYTDLATVGDDNRAGDKQTQADVARPVSCLMSLRRICSELLPMAVADSGSLARWRERPYQGLLTARAISFGYNFERKRQRATSRHTRTGLVQMSKQTLFNVRALANVQPSLRGVNRVHPGHVGNLVLNSSVSKRVIVVVLVRHSSQALPPHVTRACRHSPRRRPH